MDFERQFAGVLLDMDGTLVDSTAVVNQILGEFAADHGLDLETVLARTHGLQTVDQIRLFLPHASADEVARIEADMDLKEHTRTEGIVEVPGARRFLKRLTDLGVPWAVVTSASREVASIRLKAAGIGVPPIMVSADECSDGKPAATPYLMGVSLLGLSATDCIAFEDAEAGLISALASGATTVVVGNHSSPLADPLPRITSYAELNLSLSPSGLVVS
ncbi:HAD-IA family hydrolase [Populibacterium corticicola]|uniref:HAD-IA family hydrolase n=1 Tax=Populibacterium corticicola TaxID=1812826 RepID=A0ABW5XF84_9MICO